MRKVIFLTIFFCFLNMFLQPSYAITEQLLVHLSDIIALLSAALVTAIVSLNTSDILDEEVVYYINNDKKNLLVKTIIICILCVFSPTLLNTLDGYWFQYLILSLVTACFILVGTNFWALYKLKESIDNELRLSKFNLDKQK